MTSLGREGTVVDDKQVLVDVSVYNPTESDVPVCPEAAPQSTGGPPYYPAAPINHHTNEKTSSAPESPPAYTPSYDWQGPAPPADRAPVYAYDPAIVQAQYPGNHQVIQTQPGVNYPQHPQGGPIVYVQNPASDINFGSLTGLACFTAWCCCLCLGIAAYVKAEEGRRLAEEGRVEEARTTAGTSKSLSIAGIVVGIIIMIGAIITKFVIL